MASSLQQTAATITERSKTLINNDLKKILKEEGTSQTGNKAALQARVISSTHLRLRSSRQDVPASCRFIIRLLTSRSPVITDAVSRGDAEQIRRLQYRVQHHGAAPPPSTSSPVAPSFLQPPPPIANGHNMGNGYQSNGAYPSYQQRQQSQAPPRMPSSPSKFLESGPTYFFKESPFFKIHDLILSGMSLDR
jgi:E3 SUMO-protein ligase PIAS1